MMLKNAILLVEDWADDVALMRRTFNSLQITNPLFTVSDGDEAVDYLTGKGVYSNRLKYPLPSLVLLDLKMPRRNGFEVLEWIRAHTDPEISRAVVVVLTSSEDLGDINRSYQLGAHSFLTKTHETKKLLGMVVDLNMYLDSRNLSHARINLKPTGPSRSAPTLLLL